VKADLNASNNNSFQPVNTKRLGQESAARLRALADNLAAARNECTRAFMDEDHDEQEGGHFFSSQSQSQSRSSPRITNMSMNSMAPPS
jgi:hypothetical protein